MSHSERIKNCFVASYKSLGFRFLTSTAFVQQVHLLDVNGGQIPPITDGHLATKSKILISVKLRLEFLIIKVSINVTL